MNKNKLEFDTVSVDQRNFESLIVFQVQQLSSIVKRTSVGQFIKSSPFELHFPISIGKSKWILFLFPNGQYEAGQPNDLISIYLMLDQCEHQNADFNFDVTFQFGSEGAVVVNKKNQHLCFRSVKTRWLGTKLINVSEMILNESRLIQNDALMLTVALNERMKEELSSSPEMFFDNNYSNYSSMPSVKSENNYIDTPGSNYSFSSEPSATVEFSSKPSATVEFKYTDPPDRFTKTVPSLNRPENSTFRVEPCVRNLPPRRYSSAPYPIPSTATCLTTSSSEFDNGSASTSGTGQAYRWNTIHDSNMNCVDNEYSDDEGAQSTDSKKGIVGNLVDKAKHFFNRFK